MSRKPGTLLAPSRTKQTVRLTAPTVMGNGPTAVSEFKNGIGHRVELENRYGSLAHREFESLPLRQTDSLGIVSVFQWVGAFRSLYGAPPVFGFEPGSRSRISHVSTGREEPLTRIDSRCSERTRSWTSA